MWPRGVIWRYRSGSTLVQRMVSCHYRNQCWLLINGFLWDSPDNNFTVEAQATWWRHQMETFSALLALVRGIHRSPVTSPHKDQWRGALMFTLICARINGWVNNREAGDLRRHRAHFDVIVMTILCNEFENYTSKISAIFPRRQWVNLKNKTVPLSLNIFSSSNVLVLFRCQAIT